MRSTLFLGFWLLSGIANSLLGQTPPADSNAGAENSFNFARGFSGASILVDNSGDNNFVPNQRANSIIDDDVASGWTPPVGKTRLLVQLAQLADLNSLTLFAPAAEGSFTVYTAASAEALSNQDLTLVASDIDLNSGSQVPLDEESSLYVLIEINMISSAPIRNILISGQPSSGSIATTAVISPSSSSDEGSTAEDGEATEVNFASKALGAELTEESNSTTDSLIDGDTATSTSLEADENGKIATTIQLASAVEVDRVTLAVGSASGVVRVFSSSENGVTGRELFTVTLDGSSETLSFDVDGVMTEFVHLEWIPDTPGTPLLVKEVGIFAMARVELVAAPVGQGGKVVINSTPPTSLTSNSSPSPGLPANNTSQPQTPIEPRPVSG